MYGALWSTKWQRIGPHTTTNDHKQLLGIIKRKGKHSNNHASAPNFWECAASIKYGMTVYLQKK